MCLTCLKVRSPDDAVEAEDLGLRYQIRSDISGICLHLSHPCTESCPWKLPVGEHHRQEWEVWNRGIYSSSWGASEEDAFVLVNEIWFWGIDGVEPFGSIGGSQVTCFSFTVSVTALPWLLPSLAHQVQLKMSYWSSPSMFFVCDLANVSAGSWALAAVCLVTLASVVSLGCFWKALLWFLCERWLGRNRVPTHLIILVWNLSSGLFCYKRRKKIPNTSFYPWKQQASCSAEPAAAHTDRYCSLCLCLV